jgi:hypothetical protein
MCTGDLPITKREYSPLGTDVRPIGPLPLPLSAQWRGWSAAGLYASVISGYYKDKLPITVARSNTGVVGSNPTRGMDVCVRLFCLCWMNE